MYSAPNTRVQRTRSSPSAHRSPLTRYPLGGLVAIAGALAMTACQKAASGDPPGSELVLTPAPYRSAVESLPYQGHLEMTFERSVFIPCGSTEEWWLGTPEDSAIPGRVRALIPKGAQSQGGSGARLYVRGHGRLFGPGHFGHLGAYAHEVALVNIDELRLAEANDCERSK